MLKTDRKPAFWRVVRVKDGVREYVCFADSAGGDWTNEIASASIWLDRDYAERNASGGRVVPVYVTVRKVPRGQSNDWRRVTDDTAFARPFGTIRQCRVCGCLVGGGPNACVRCVKAEAAP